MIVVNKIERHIKLAREEHDCPYCSQRLSCCEAPPFHVGDGLGWGTDIFFVCLNNECSLFADSWENFEEEYGHTASCRYVLLPDAAKGEAMMVGSADAFTGSIVDIDSLLVQNKRFEREQEAVQKLDACVQEKNLAPVIYLILDECARLADRCRACELLIPLNDLACIDQIRNHKFHHTEIGQKANLAIVEILKANLAKECPYCVEIIKLHAKICKHCGKDV